MTHEMLRLQAEPGGPPPDRVEDDPAHPAADGVPERTAGPAAEPLGSVLARRRGGVGVRERAAMFIAPERVRTYRPIDNRRPEAFTCDGAFIFTILPERVMSSMPLHAELLAGNVKFLEGTLADFSDADMLARPVPAANHAAWQIGHLIVAETNMVNSVKPGALPELPAGFAEKFTKETAKISDPAAFPKKAELLAQFEKTRAASVEWAKSLTAADMQQPTNERLARFAPTVGHLVSLLPTHVAMHVGQFQVIRRALGKPVLF